MAKPIRTPQKSKPYQPKVVKEKSFKIRNVDIKKRPKHKKTYYNDNESYTEDEE
jgi:hypothetical protein